MFFSQRLIEPELLDSAERDEARLNLDDLLRINRYFGGHSVIRKTIARAVDGRKAFTLLDVGAASGDTARTIREMYSDAKVISLDYNSNNLEAADQPKLLGDAFQLPFDEGSFDYVMCSLFLHHFTNPEVVSLLTEFKRVARRGVLVCDLERNVLPFLFLPATKPIFKWQRLTMHDGPISVRAAFRKQELHDLAEKAGFKKIEIRNYRPAFRLSMVATKG